VALRLDSPADRRAALVVAMTFREVQVHAWIEAFNSDYYDKFPNPAVRGNAGRILAAGPNVTACRPRPASPSRRTGCSYSPATLATEPCQLTPRLCGSPLETRCVERSTASTQTPYLQSTLECARPSIFRRSC
jgi:hypothetical protein